MEDSNLYKQYLGHFVDVRLKEEDEFIKTVFVRSCCTEHGQIRRAFIYADIVPDGDEEEYLSKHAIDPDAFQKLPLPEEQIAEVKVGNKINF
jgi:hypothetical protein